MFINVCVVRWFQCFDAFIVYALFVDVVYVCGVRMFQCFDAFIVYASFVAACLCVCRALVSVF